jgi:hypothetical protein
MIRVTGTSFKPPVVSNRPLNSLNQLAPSRHNWVYFFECNDIALPVNSIEYV